MEILLIWMLCGIFSGVVAGNKGHGGCLWTVGGVFFGPLALIATLGLGDKNQRTKQDQMLDELRRQNDLLERKMRRDDEEY